MRICISHRTALSYLLRTPFLCSATGRSSRASSIPKEVPDQATARALFDVLSPSLHDEIERLDVMVSTRAGRHKSERVRPHLCTIPLPEGSFLPETVMGTSFHVCAPELVYLQMAAELDFDHLVYVGCALCSDFRLDDFEVGGCLLRSGRDGPLTTVEKMRAYLERIPPRTRGRASALRALEHVLEGARSPREIGLAMVMGMPLSRGGLALGEVALNQEMRVYDGVDGRGEARWVVRIPDILVSALDEKGRRRLVGVDFDASSTHMSPERVLSDVERRNLLAANGGFAHITIGSAQVRDYVAFRREMDRVRRALGQRKKPRLTGNRDSERNRRHAAMIAHRQFELWDRVLGSSCFKL